MASPNIFRYYHERLRRTLDDAQGALPENPLTEAVAFYLSCDREALRDFCKEIVGVQQLEPVAVNTQVPVIGGTVDLVIDFGGKTQLLLEHKLDAPLGRRQVEKYLDSLGADGGWLALISRRHQSISAAVLNHTSYRRPRSHDHFSWRDLYSVVPKSTDSPLDQLREHFRQYLDSLGFGPSPIGWEGLFLERTEPRNQKVQRQFGDLLSSAKAFFNRSGFKVGATSHKGFTARPRTRRPYLHLVVWPGMPRASELSPDQARLCRGHVLVVGIVYDGGKASSHARRMNEAFPNPSFRDTNGFHWVAVPPRQIGSNRTRLEFVTNLDPFLADPDLIELRIASSVEAVVEELWRLDGTCGR